MVAVRVDLMNVSRSLGDWMGAARVITTVLANCVHGWPQHSVERVGCACTVLCVRTLHRAPSLAQGNMLVALAECQRACEQRGGMPPKLRAQLAR